MSNGTIDPLGPSAEEMDHLLRHCGAGDQRAWDRVLSLVRRLSLELGRWKYRLGSEDAEDLAQVVQLRVADRLPQLRDPQAFPAWVRQVTHRVALDTLRQRRATCSLDDPLVNGEADCDPEAVRSYDRIVLRADLDRALSRLPAHYREPIELHLLEGLPQEVIGQLLGRPRSTVASQIDRGLRHLQRTVSPSLAG